MDDVPQLRAGDRHYRAYVGPPLEYDLMGATQFRLLTALGLREHHKLLDLGCGSLRAGRLFIPYLNRGNYCGIEPNAWLVEEGLDRELGRDILEVKAPRFDCNDLFDCGVFGETFDFIIAQSIFSHTAADLFVTGLRSALASLAPTGLLLATFVRPEAAAKGQPGWNASGWIYPSVATFSDEAIERVFAAAAARARLLPWRHPRQQWFAAATQDAVLPARMLDAELTGFTLGVSGYC